MLPVVSADLAGAQGAQLVGGQRQLAVSARR
jgi:hypothetical protein